MQIAVIVFVIKLSTTEQFFKDIEKGKKAEKQFEKLCNCLDINFEDVRLDKEYQAIDVDYLCWNDKDKRKQLAEIKLDNAFGKYAKEKQRFFIEDISSNYVNSDGWYRYCKADILFIMDAINNIFYAFRVRDLREYIDYYWNNKNNRCNRVVYVNAGNGKGYGVNIGLFYKWLDGNGKLNKVYDMGKFVD